MAPVDETLSLEDLAAGQTSLRNLMTAFWGARALHAAVQLGLFETLRVRPLKAAEAAEKLQADARSCEILLNALVALGLLEREDGAYRNSAVSQMFLLNGTDHDHSAFANAMASEWQAWEGLDDAIRTGAPATHVPRGGANEAAAAGAIASVTAPLIVKKVDLSRVKRVLDVGGGSAAAAIAIARAQPSAEVRLLETPDRASAVRKQIAAAGLDDRIRLEVTEPLQADLGKDNLDLVLIPNLHTYPEASSRALLKKAFEAIVSEGRCVISDVLLRDDRTGPLPPTLLALRCLLLGGGSRAYSGWEVTDAMQTEGFIRVQIVPLSPSAQSLVIGTRP